MMKACSKCGLYPKVTLTPGTAWDFACKLEVQGYSVRKVALQPVENRLLTAMSQKRGFLGSRLCTPVEKAGPVFGDGELELLAGQPLDGGERRRCSEQSPGFLMQEAGRLNTLWDTGAQGVTRGFSKLLSFAEV